MAEFKGEVVIGRRRIMNVIFVGLFIYACICLFMFFNQRSFIYFPSKDRPNPVEAGLPGVEVIAINPEGMDKAIQGWYQAPSDPSKPVIIYFHGNAGGIDIRAYRIKHYIQQGYGVMMAEYRGYSGNPGKPTEKGLFADALAYYDWVTHNGNIPENQVVLYGESLGTGVAVWLASQKPNIKGLVLEAPFTSLADLIRWKFFFIPVDVLLSDRYTSLKRITDVTAPVLVIHGEKDKVVPAKYGKRIHAAANNPKTITLIAEGGHDDLYDFGAAQAILQFLGGLK